MTQNIHREKLEDLALAYQMAAKRADITAAEDPRFFFQLGLCVAALSEQVDAAPLQLSQQELQHLKTQLILLCDQDGAKLPKDTVKEAEILLARSMDQQVFTLNQS